MSLVKGLRDFNNDDALLLINKYGALLLDIRTKEEYCKGHVQGAILVPTALPPLSDREIQTLKDQLWWATKQYATNKNVPIVLYCKKGKRAGVAKEMLNEMGFKNVLNWGGVEVPGDLNNMFRNRLMICGMKE